MRETFAVETGRCIYTQIRTVTVRGRTLTLLYSPDVKFVLVNGVIEMDREDAPSFLSGVWDVEPEVCPRPILEGDLDGIRGLCPSCEITKIVMPEERRQRLLPFLEGGVPA